jgi:thiaminase/transcriptional activator TenA
MHGIGIWLLAVTVMAPRSVGESFTERLWSENRDIYIQILEHPFLKELGSGKLDREAFSHYMIQDAHYLREFSRALRITAAKAPRAEWAALLNRHAGESLTEERRLHTEVFRSYAITEAQVEKSEPAPEAFAYMNFLVATASTGSFGEALSALLPCYWIYAEVGKELRKSGSRDPVYQKWIDNYSSAEYEKSVRAVLDIMDEAARSASPAGLARMRANFRRSCRYEWMFWDSAYYRRGWPPPAR